ncbi:MAG TPA: carboxylesterase family protein [Acidimicrobiia bacterium]
MSRGPVVDTASGRVRGATVAAPDGPRVHRFLGIPYAAPPLGDLRWRTPQPPVPWPGTRDAAAFGDAAPQADPIEDRLPGFKVRRASEDCLTLNVWTPALDGARPVMVWIHGGAYTSGGSAQPVYDAARLAAEGDLVVVTINYRLGALGFLAPAGDATANCGLHDQLAALAWVRVHAAAFGGDARRVTAFGESAGAGSILHLLASRLRKGAFERAIVQSGEPRTLTRDEAAVVAVAVARSVGLGAPDAGRLRTVPVERLVAAQEAAVAETATTIGMMPFNPSIDGDLCDRTVRDAIGAGRADDAAIVIGTTRDELSLFADPRAASLDGPRLARWAARLLSDGADVDAAIAAYEAQLGDGATKGRIWDALRTDAYMRIPNLQVADAHAARGAATYVYRFDWDAPGLGAAHAVDVPFVFGTFDREGWGRTIGYDADAARLSAVIRRAWATFAATGVPDAGVDWRAYDSERRPTLLLTRSGALMMDDPGGTTRRCLTAQASRPSSGSTT